MFWPSLFLLATANAYTLQQGDNPYEYGCDIVVYCLEGNPPTFQTITQSTCETLGANCSDISTNYDFEVTYDAMIENFENIVSVSNESIGLYYGSMVLPCAGTYTFEFPIHNPTYMINTYLGLPIGVYQLAYLGLTPTDSIDTLSTYATAADQVTGGRMSLIGYGKLPTLEIFKQGPNNVSMLFSWNAQFQYNFEDEVFYPLEMVVNASSVCSENMNITYAFMYPLVDGPPKPTIPPSKTPTIEGLIIVDPLNTTGNALYSEELDLSNFTNPIIDPSSLSSIQSSVTLQIYTDTHTYSDIMYILPNCPINATCLLPVMNTHTQNFTLEGRFELVGNRVRFTFGNATLCLTEGCDNALIYPFEKAIYVATEIPTIISGPTPPTTPPPTTAPPTTTPPTEKPTEGPTEGPTDQPTEQPTESDAWTMNGAAWLIFGLFMAFIAATGLYFYLRKPVPRNPRLRVPLIPL